MKKEAKVKIYKAIAKTTITYSTETKPETKRIKQKMRTIVMRVLRTTSKVTIGDR